MQRRKSLALVTTLTAIVGVIAALAFVRAGDATGGRQGAPALIGNPLGSALVGNGRAAILDRVPSADDLPSQRTLDLQGGHSMLSGMKDVRLARSAGPVRVLVAPAGHGSDICLIVEDSSEDSTAIDCTRRSVLAKGAIYLTKPDSATATVDLFALVGDGVIRVGPARVENNVAIIEDFSGQLITLTDNAGRISTVDLGPQF